MNPHPATAVGRLLVLLLLPLLLAGCWVSYASRTQHDTASGRVSPLPTRGGKMTPDDWAALDRMASARRLDVARGYFFFIPLRREATPGGDAVSSFTDFHMYPPLFLGAAFGAVRARSGRTSAIDGMNTWRLHFQILPLYLRAGTAFHEYERSENASGPARSAWAEFNPFWSAAHSAPGSAVRMRARTIPLLFGDLLIEAEENPPAGAWPALPVDIQGGRVRAMNSLAGMGPFAFSLDVPGGKVRWFEPLSLGHVGSLIWVSIRLETDRGESQIHGPSLLAYLSLTDRVRQRDTRMLAQGILWYSGTQWADRAAAEVERSRHGPLWGMFGWGRRQTRPVFYVLWFPVPRPF